MESLNKFHAIKIDETKCIGCVHCMQSCPTEAIRIVNGVARIKEERCVDCGNCLRVCPVDAFYVEQDSLEQINNYKYRVVLFPSVLIGQFPAIYSEGAIYSALKSIGFTHIFEVEQPIGVLIDLIKKNVLSAVKKPVISSFCPAIVRLIQCKYPSLVEHIIPLKAPHDLAAHFAIHILEKEGVARNEIGIFYVSPCSAKMAAVKRPMGEDKSIVDGLINMNELYNRLMKQLKNKDTNIHPLQTKNITRDGIVWSLPRGEAQHFQEKAMAIDGIHNVVKFLERMENGEIPALDFLEFKSCNQGCAGGILLTGNRFLTVERLQKRSKKYPVANSDVEKTEDSMFSEKLKAGKIEPNYVFSLDNNREKAFEKMEKMDRILCQLPGIDCGGCGAPNCHALAEDIVQHKAKLTDCIFLQKRYIKDKKITFEKSYNSLEKTWGKNRFEADCNKKGGRNEGF